MKPNAHTVDAALRIAGVEPDEAILMGGSVSDVEVVRAVGVRSLGHAMHVPIPSASVGVSVAHLE